MKVVFSDPLRSEGMGARDYVSAGNECVSPLHPEPLAGQCNLIRF